MTKYSIRRGKLAREKSSISRKTRKQALRRKMNRLLSKVSISR